MPTRLDRHEIEIARSERRRRRSGSLGGAFARFGETGIGNFLVNTPAFLLPRIVRLEAKHRVLELGCGGGARLRLLTGRYAFQTAPVGMDLSGALLRRGRRAAGAGAFPLVQGTPSRLPFADAAFDLIIAGHLIRHLSEEGLMRLLIEALRVLRPGGLLALWEFAPAAESRAGRLARRTLETTGVTGTLRDFSRLASLASEAGYDLVEEPQMRAFLLPPVPRVALLARKAAEGDAQPCLPEPPPTVRTAN